MRLVSFLKGQGILEVIIAMAIFAIISVAMVTLVLGSTNALIQGGEQTEAEALAREAIEAVRSVRDGAWNEIEYTQVEVIESSGQWEIVDDVGGDGQDIGKFNRTINIEDVCRDALDEIVACPGNYTDPHTKKIATDVTWTTASGKTNMVMQISYFTNWDSKDWIQTDWSGGSGQTVWANADEYDSDDGNVEVGTAGQVTLKQVQGACTGYTWNFDTPGDYNYDSGKIEVTGGKAQLKSGVTTESGNTTDPGFDTGTPWSEGDWDDNSFQEIVTNARTSTNGNPTWWAYNYLRARDNREVGGYWEQSINITEDNPDNVTIEFDYQPWTLIIQSVDTAWFYVFLETSSGEPAGPGSALWSHQFTGSDTLQQWIEDVTVNATGAVTTAGTYYLKLAMWLDTGNGPGNSWRYVAGGWDNAELTWQKDVSSYPSDNPSINPTASFTPGNADAWTGFSETATKNGGEVYYQLSDSDGSTWQYWNGSAWVAAGGGNYNTASDVNDYIDQFDASSGDIMFRAFLDSDGTHQVELDDVTVDCGNFQIEVGEVSTDENWVTVNMANTYEDPIVVASYYEDNNSEDASARIQNLDEDSFEIRLQSPSTGSLSSDVISYMVVEEGLWDMDGVLLEARKYNTNTVGSQSGGWNYDSVSFTQNFTSDPIVAHQVMTNNDTDWITTYVSRDTTISDPPDSDGMRIALNGAEADSTHGTETIGWIAIERNETGTIDGVDFETDRTSDSVRGHDNGCYAFNYQNSYSSTPVTLGFLLEMDGNNGGWCVECNKSSSQASFHIEEDQAGDGERSHTTETVGFIAFENSFDYTTSSGGGGYETSGTLTSSAYDMGANTRALQVIDWDESNMSCPSCDISFQVRSADTQPNLSSASWSTSYSDATGSILPKINNGDRWVQYRMNLTGDGTDSPVLEEIRVNYK